MLMAVSLGLRIWLAALGGQDYWPDEIRYNSSRDAVAALRHGQWDNAAQELLGHADHTLFRWFGLLPALVESLVGHNLPSIAAAYFGLYSVLVIFLIWAISRRAGGSEQEALWAAYLAACSNSLFYYSRHFFPYDVSLSLMLLGFWLGLGPWSWRNSIWVGLAASLGFLTYNGYWLIGGCILILHVLLGEGGRQRMVNRMAWSAVGLILPIVTLAGLAAALGYDLVSENYNYGLIAKGDFPFGHRVVAGYLWYAEGGLVVIWLVALAYALSLVVRVRRWDQLAWHAGGLALVLGGLLGLSDIIHQFAVQGRRVRELVPFLCLGAAVGIAEFVQRRPAYRRYWTLALTLLVGGMAAWNLSVPLRQVFPNEFQRLATAAAARQSEIFAYRLIFVQHLWGLSLDTPPWPHETILRRTHPLQFLPYQYEGFDMAQRAELNAHDINMRLIGVPLGMDKPDLRWRGFPGPIRLVVRFPMNAPNASEPLVTTGQTGRGETLYVRYIDGTHVSISLDHWGFGGASSAPIAVDYGTPHEILIFAGFLLPPEEMSLEAKFPELAEQRGHVLVMIDGRPVFHAIDPVLAVPRASIQFGVNFIGSSPTRASFSGDIIEFTPAPAASLKTALALLTAGEPAARLARNRPHDWKGAVGPVRLRLVLPTFSVADSEPLLSIIDYDHKSLWDMSLQDKLVKEKLFSKIRTGSLLFLRRENQGHIRLGFSDGNKKPILSELLPVDPAATQEITISLGSLLPPDDGVIYATDANLGALRDLLEVRLNGRLVLQERQNFTPAFNRVVFGLNLFDNSPSSLFFKGTMVSIDALDTLAVRGPKSLAEIMPPADREWLGYPYPGPICLEVIFPREGKQPEPLLVSGITGAADVLYVRYLDESHVQVGLDHWGHSATVSEIITVQPRAEQKFIISLGSLLPPGSDEIYHHYPDWARLRQLLFVSLNGRTILEAPMEFHPARADQLIIGSNLAGGSVVGPNFKGQIISVTRVPSAQIPTGLSPPVFIP